MNAPTSFFPTKTLLVEDESQDGSHFRKVENAGFFWAVRNVTTGKFVGREVCALADDGEVVVEVAAAWDVNAVEVFHCDDSGFTHAHTNCPLVEGETRECGLETGWACECVEFPSVALWAETCRRSTAKDNEPGAGGDKGNAVLALVRERGELRTKDVAALVGCTVARVNEVVRASSELERPRRGFVALAA